MVRKARASCVLLVLTLFLGIGTANASPLSNRPNPEGQPTVLAAFREWVTSLRFFEVNFFVEESEDDGSVPNPPPTNGPQSDIGGFIDPNGGS